MRTVLIVLLVALSITGCTARESSALLEPAAVSGGSGSTGGSVSGSDPSVTAFTSDKSSGDNAGSFVVVLTGTAFSPNGEKKLDKIEIIGAGPATMGANHTVTSAEVDARTEPASFGADGFKAWNPTDKDGNMQFRYRQPFAVWTPAGAYSFTARAYANGNRVSPPSAPVAITITKFSLITVAGAPVNAAGVAQTGAAWGGWSAAPNAENVAATNYLKLVNDGDKPDVSIVIDFTDGSFKGATDNAYAIPIDANVQFAWATGSPSSTPAQLTFSYLPLSGSGSTTVTFANKGDVAFVSYRIAKLPGVLDVQSYSAAFTVTEI